MTIEKSLNAPALIDLHLHLDGSLPVPTVYALAKAQHITLPQDVESQLSVPQSCRSLKDYLDCFALPGSLLQTPEALAEAVYALQEDLLAQGLLYAEIRFAPQKHTDQGLTQREVIQAAVDGLSRSTFHAKLLLCCMRGEGNERENQETVELAPDFKDKGVAGLDLAGNEAAYPTRNYKKLFAAARETGMPFTIHAGEADGAISVRDALEFGASRIGHGLRSIEDAGLVRELARRGIAPELCPTSNLQTKAIATLKTYPLPHYLKQSVPATVNTDNTTVSRTTLRRELTLCAEEMGLSRADLLQTQCNAANVAFIDEAARKALENAVRAAYQA